MNVSTVTASFNDDRFSDGFDLYSESEYLSTLLPAWVPWWMVARAHLGVRREEIEKHNNSDLNLVRKYYVGEKKGEGLVGSYER